MSGVFWCIGHAGGGVAEGGALCFTGQPEGGDAFVVVLSVGVVSRGTGSAQKRPMMADAI